MNSEAVNHLMTKTALDNLNEEDDDEDELLTSSHSTGTGFLDLENDKNASEEAREMRDTVIKKEEKAVKRSRVLVGAAVALCAIAVSIAVYFISKANDQNSFEIEVRNLNGDETDFLVHSLDLTSWEKCQITTSCCEYKLTGQPLVVPFFLA